VILAYLRKLIHFCEFDFILAKIYKRAVAYLLYRISIIMNKRAESGKVTHTKTKLHKTFSMFFFAVTIRGAEFFLSVQKILHILKL
jgi:hypothetical protein